MTDDEINGQQDALNDEYDGLMAIVEAHHGRRGAKLAYNRLLSINKLINPHMGGGKTRKAKVRKARGKTRRAKV